MSRIKGQGPPTEAPLRLVRPTWQKTCTARRIHDALLATREESYIALMVNSAADDGKVHGGTKTSDRAGLADAHGDAPGQPVTNPDEVADEGRAHHPRRLGRRSPNGFLTVVFAAHEWMGDPENREPRKHAQVCWVDTDAIPEEFVDTTASALRRYLGDGPQVSLDGWKQS